MASVRISDRLINETKDNIDSMRQAEQRRTPAVQEVISVLPNDQRIINRYVLPQERDAYRIVPRDWLDTHDTISLYLEFTLNPEAAEPKGTSAELSLVPPVGVKFVLPHGRYQRYDSNKRLKAKYDDGIWPEAQAYVEKRRSDYEVAQRWNKVKQDVLTFLKQYPSLNAAVKAWPGVKLYVPKSYLDALERKVERSAAPIEAPVINYDELTAAAVAHRMGV